MISCENCAACCGPVPVTYQELENIKSVWNQLPHKRRQQIKQQQRDMNTCILLDTKTKKCSVYESRPLICKMFGYHEGLQCTYFPNEPLEPKKVGNKLIQESGKPVGILSQSIGYQHLERG